MLFTPLSVAPGLITTIFQVEFGNPCLSSGHGRDASPEILFLVAYSGLTDVNTYIAVGVLGFIQLLLFCTAGIFRSCLQASCFLCAIPWACSMLAEYRSLHDEDDANATTPNVLGTPIQDNVNLIATE